MRERVEGEGEGWVVGGFLSLGACVGCVGCEKRGLKDAKYLRMT